MARRQEVPSLARAEADRMKPRPLLPAGRAVRVLLVDDQELVRAGLRALLVGQEEILVVGEAATAAAALAACCLIHPNVMLVDTTLPAWAAFSLIRKVRDRSPEIGVIALTEGLAPSCGALHPATPPLTPGDTSEWGPARVSNCAELALRAGARGVLSKTDSPAEMLEAIRVVAQGERWLKMRRASRLLNLGQRPSQPTQASTMPEGLTPREVEIIRELLTGRSNKQIGRELRLHEQTIKNAISRILSRLHLHDRVQIALYAVETRLLERYTRTVQKERSREQPAEQPACAARRAVHETANTSAPSQRVRS